MSHNSWYENGLRFDCTQCGNCCRDHGDHDRVYVGPGDIDRLARHLGLDRDAFLAAHTEEEDGYTILRQTGPACGFLEGHGTCAVYQARPTQCATWPFWWENLKRERWEGAVSDVCPGIDRGALHPVDEIEASAERTETALDE